jgi:hypothetical protein
MSIGQRDALRRLIELNFTVGSAGPVRLRDRDWQYIEMLALKVTQHAASALWLAESKTRFKPGQSGIIDWPSIHVLCRACMEAYLALHHVYISPEDRDVAEFRYCSWMISGFAIRQAFPVVDQETRERRAADAKFLERIRRRIAKTAAFHGLKPRKQKAVLAGRDWPPDTTFTKLAREAFGHEIGGSAYRFFSGQAHSSSLSAVQMRDVVGEEAQRRMADMALWLIAQSVAKTTKVFAGKFVAARKALKKHPDASLNDLWADLSDLPPTIYGVEDEDPV